MFEDDSSFHHYGVQFVLENLVFVPGFFCQLEVQILNTLKESLILHTLTAHEQFDIIKVCKEKVTKVSQNGMIVTCPGLFTGEIIVVIATDHRSIFIILKSTSPSLDIATSVFRKLVSEQFPQCIFLDITYCNLI